MSLFSPQQKWVHPLPRPYFDPEAFPPSFLSLFCRGGGWGSSGVDAGQGCPPHTDCTCASEKKALNLQKAKNVTERSLNANNSGRALHLHRSVTPNNRIIPLLSGMTHLGAHCTLCLKMLLFPQQGFQKTLWGFCLFLFFTKSMFIFVRKATKSQPLGIKKSMNRPCEQT